MKLTHIRVKDFRSFVGEHEFEVASGVNYYVGPNNCGKSNLIRALELALDPDARYAPEADRPARPGSLGAPPTTRITLTFQVGTSGPEKTLLQRAKKYELAVRRARNASTTGGIKTYAGEQEVRLATSFGAGGARQTTFQAKGFGAASLPLDSEEHQKLEAQFRSVVRFAVVHSGEDLASLLQGKFREILQLVIADHLGAEMSAAEQARVQYLDSLKAELLEPLRKRVLARVGDMFPEITLVDLVPDVPRVTDTLSSVDVQLGDLATTGLASKGTGVRGAVLISMLQYLAEQSRRSLVLAVEEPEAFLHPAAQETIKSQLEELATRADVSLIVTTHSPYVISRRPDCLVSELRKGSEGATLLRRTAHGHENRSELLGALYRDAGLARVVERSLEIPDTTRAVLVTEGYTDGLFLRLVCAAVGRADLLKDLHYLPAGSAAKVVPFAILAKAATEAPVIALLDHDDNGRAALAKLKSFNWRSDREILSLSAWHLSCGNHDVEIEDLLPTSAVARIVARLGEDASIDAKIKCGDAWHVSYSAEWKDAAIESLARVVDPAEEGGMIWLAEEVWRRADKIRKSKEQAALHLAKT